MIRGFKNAYDLAIAAELEYRKHKRFLDRLADDDLQHEKIYVDYLRSCADRQWRYFRELLSEENPLDNYIGDSDPARERGWGGRPTDAQLLSQKLNSGAKNCQLCQSVLGPTEQKLIFACSEDHFHVCKNCFDGCIGEWTKKLQRESTAEKKETK